MSIWARLEPGLFLAFSHKMGKYVGHRRERKKIVKYADAFDKRSADKKWGDSASKIKTRPASLLLLFQLTILVFDFRKSKNKSCCLFVVQREGNPLYFHTGRVPFVKEDVHPFAIGIYHAGAD